MKKIKKLLCWYHTFHKRFFLKKSYIVLLLLVPIMGLLLGITATMDSGMLTVCLSSEGDDAVSDAIIEELLCEKGIIRFLRETPEKAIELLKFGKADAAWIFREDFSEKAKNFAERQSSSNSLVTVLQREEGIAQMLSREKLCGILYPYVSEQFYISYVKNEIAVNIDDEAALKYYNTVMPEGTELFDFSFTRNDNAPKGYLTAPLRGLLSVMVVLSAFAVSMFYKMDEEREMFARIEKMHRILFAFGYHFSAVLDVGVAMIISLALCGVWMGTIRELTMLIIFVFITVLFSMAVERLLKRLNIFAALIPLLIIAMIVICPVFFSFNALKPIQMLFPPYYYLEAMAGADNLVSIFVYAISLVFANVALYSFSRENRSFA